MTEEEIILPTNKPTSKKAFTRILDELKQKIEGIENQAKDMMRAAKAPLYREYAKKLAMIIDATYVQEELCRHFPKDNAVIRYALKDMPQYKNLSKDTSESGIEDYSSISCEAANAIAHNKSIEQLSSLLPSKSSQRLIELVAKYQQLNSRMDKMTKQLSQLSIDISNEARACGYSDNDDIKKLFAAILKARNSYRPRPCPSITIKDKVDLTLSIVRIRKLIVSFNFSIVSALTFTSRS